MDVARGGEGGVTVGKDLKKRRLVGHQRPDLLRMPFHERQRIHRSTAAGEEVNRACIERLDEPMQVVRVLLGRRRAGRIGLLAPLRAAGIVGNDGAVREVAAERAESRGAHR